MIFVLLEAHAPIIAKGKSLRIFINKKSNMLKKMQKLHKPVKL